MKKVYLEFSLIVILILLLILPSAFFINILSHEYYHVYKNNPYSESVCLDLTQPIKAYTVVNYPNLTTKLSYSNDYRLQEEVKANNFGRLISFLYILFITLITTAFIISIKNSEK
ncbi:MAG: hypothetical protein AABW45_01675 [Nanoarchaeota archaeon]